ncbi:16S rRNA (uracil(1498)-N(3))-methyltransferase [Dasania sp. GY-MA-18]|uniref:Ribosomal RNA small subunit methyltransferase E n=1 Tax=Dasania phycosphaerae TaxID=2950436 RepID=A0A9J6RJK6_9GAMM|nr:MULTISPECIES: 16S rRNA (uracil(1498)-N(3))-methyltransferase [Dasania]MCR8922150.1 16S rRNA (uracil(1498)-N(3))-methyltransferase [Dasania sp. GY-MA-18]MCZ0864578.1 16S rRNA (uracil(1498)-N(3))-methyltransferase [Dasania phycosphaerae]MCZ0868306.1 16S rRNA (uracil(1498)-N(3))-methyltransferase [Dasania phycosphaerae]
MRVPRIFTQNTLVTGQTVELEAQASHHLSKVLRMQNDAALILFNNQGGEFDANIVSLSKKSVSVIIGEHRSDNRQSPLPVHLGIAMSKGDRMDWVMQKATELGATEITPLYTERTELKLKADRAEKKHSHWQNIIISACEQCQRNLLPQLHAPTPLLDWLNNSQAEKKLVLHHRNTKKLNPADSPNSAAILIGPEGGLSDHEIEQALAQGFNALSLGPRVLRTETAPLAALTLLQSLWGDI